MSYFKNCTLTVSRSEGKRTAQGYEETSTTTVLEARADAQESGRALERAQQLHETGDVLVFCEGSVTAVEPGDKVTLDMDDGQTLTGSVEEVFGIDNKLLITI